MRVLLTHHLPPQSTPSGFLCARLVDELSKAGHEARMLYVDSVRPTIATPSTRVVFCEPRAADLPFMLPGFSGEPRAGQEWRNLSNDQLSAYREALRKSLDAEVNEFDPQVIHAQHVWLWGQLALETGVPYLVSAWAPELAARLADARLRELAEQAAENAGRIIAHDSEVASQVAAAYPDAAERIVAAPRTTAEWVALYQAVIDERFGR